VATREIDFVKVSPRQNTTLAAGEFRGNDDCMALAAVSASEEGLGATGPTDVVLETTSSGAGSSAGTSAKSRCPSRDGCSDE
jgi:hypothetical protein